MERWHLVERLSQVPRVEQEKRPPIGHKDVLDADILAAGSAQAADVPRVVNRDVANGHARVDDLRAPWAAVRMITPSMTRQPAQSQSECVTPLANGHRPLTRTPPSTRTACPAGAAISAVGAGMQEDLPGALLGHVSGRDVVRDPHHGAPPGGSIRHRDGFDGSHELERRRFLAANRARHTQTEHLGLPELVCEVARQPACLQSPAPLTNLRQEVVDIRRNAIHVHGCLLKRIAADGPLEAAVWQRCTARSFRRSWPYWPVPAKACLILKERIDRFVQSHATRRHERHE